MVSVKVLKGSIESYCWRAPRGRLRHRGQRAGRAKASERLRVASEERLLGHHRARRVLAFRGMSGVPLSFF